MKKTIKAVLEITLPVLLGYFSIGLAFGLMLQAIGYNGLWAGFMSLVIYAGSLQYIAVDLLATAAPIVQVVVMTLLISSRQMVYGLTLIQKFKGMGKKKPYMIFALTDETYALLSSVEPPEGVDEKQYYFLISLFDHAYWIIGSVFGAAAGSLLNINTAGVDFAMTALFLVICTEQWLTYPSRIPAVIGGICTFAALVLFGEVNMLVAALVAILAIFIAGRKKIEPLVDETKNTASENA